MKPLCAKVSPEGTGIINQPAASGPPHPQFSSMYHRVVRSFTPSTPATFLVDDFSAHNFRDRYSASASTLIVIQLWFRGSAFSPLV